VGAGSKYDERTTEISRGGKLLLYTDGLPDSIRADDPEARTRDVVRTPVISTTPFVRRTSDLKWSRTNAH
jgi:hypothetical protein